MLLIILIAAIGFTDKGLDFKEKAIKVGGTIKIIIII